MALGHGACRKIESSAQSITVNSAWSVGAGSLLVASVHGWVFSTTTTSASGGTNGSYTKVAASGTGQGVALFYKANSSAGTESLTASCGGSYVTAFFAEVTGADTTAPFTEGEAAASSFTATTNPQTGSVTNSAADSIFFAAISPYYGLGGATITPDSTGSSPTGWALQDTTHSQEINGASYEVGDLVHLVVSSSAATKHGWTIISGTGNWAIAAFKAAAAPPAVVGRSQVVIVG